MTAETLLTPGYSNLVWTGGGGGVPLKPQNLYLFLESFWQRKAPIFRDFAQNIGPFSQFPGVHPKILEKQTIFRDISEETGTHILGFLVKKCPIKGTHPHMS